jgi:hypothetical protein
MATSPPDRFRFSTRAAPRASDANQSARSAPRRAFRLPIRFQNTTTAFHPATHFNMTSSSSLTGSQLQTYESIFHHPAPHNLVWHDVHILLRQLGAVTEEANGNLKATRNGRTLTLHVPRTKEVTDLFELTELRKFLEQSETPLPATIVGKSHWLVVINHHQARIFHSEMPPKAAQQILSQGPHEFFRHAHNSKDFSRGMEKPDANSFFGAVVNALISTPASLKKDGEIVIFGSGKGQGSEMEQFVAWVKSHRPEIARRIVGTLVVDEHHLTDAQLLERAREFHARLSPNQTTVA